MAYHLMKLAVAIIAVLGFFIGINWWDDTYAAPTRLERRYLSAQHNIRQARADLFRAQQECRAQVIEFGREIASACIDNLQYELELARTTTDSAEQAMRKLEQQHCPGQAWCP